MSVNLQRSFLLALRHHDVGTFPERRIRRLGVGIRCRCRINVGLGHIFDFFPVSLCIFREVIERNPHGTFFFHGDFPFLVGLSQLTCTSCLL